MEQFYQKTFSLKKKFTFKENGVDIDFKDSDGNFSLFINYDRILPRENTRVFTKHKKRILQIGLLLAGLTFLRGIISVNSDKHMTFAPIATSLIVAAIFYGYYYLTKVKYYAIGLEDNKRFQVIYNKPSHQAVLDFLDDLFERRKIYYRNEYFIINYENERKKEIDKMKWLLSEKVITENEFNVVLDEINENLDD